MRIMRAGEGAGSGPGVAPHPTAKPSFTASRAERFGSQAPINSLEPGPSRELGSSGQSQAVRLGGGL